MENGLTGNPWNDIGFGTVFDTASEMGCIAVTHPDDAGNFDGMVFVPDGTPFVDLHKFIRIFNVSDVRNCR